MAKQKYLIINADDYGISQETNYAIENLFKEERITSTSLLTGAKYTLNAITEAKKIKIPVGVHWAIHSDWNKPNRWNANARNDLVSSFTENGELYADSKYVLKNAKSKEISIELESQIKFMLEHGLFPENADSHGGTLYGSGGRLFFINAFRLCKKYNLPFRLPKKKDFLKRQFPSEAPKMLSTLFSFIVALSQIYEVKLIDDYITNPDSVHTLQTYENLRDYYLHHIHNMGSGVTELFLHPSLPDSHAELLTNQWQKRIWEYQFLKDELLFQLIKKDGIKLISWRDLP